MEFSKEFIEEQKLSEDQVKAVAGVVTENWNTKLADEKKAWDGVANENAEKILQGAANYAIEKSGVALQRNQGEKYGDFLTRIYDTSFEGKNTKIEALKTDYETKLKEFKGGDALKVELDQAKTKLDEALQKYADYDTLKEKAQKAEEYGEQLSGLKLEVAFNSIKPTFPKEVNSYEAGAKWEAFKKDVLSKGTIELVDNQPILVDKENHHKTTKLADIIAKDETIQNLIKGRQQTGTGADPVNMKKIEGVPFEVPKDADGKKRSELIKEYLKTKGVEQHDPNYALKFAEINKKILAGKTAA